MSHPASVPQRRSYSQFCGLARALDVLGERWTLLIVRELLTGPKRFGDLADGLPGIGPNLLSARLKTLEATGAVAKRKLPPPAGSMVYELTERGRNLEPALLELMRWGVELLEERRPEDTFQARWLVTSLKAVFDPERAGDLDATCELHVEGEVVSVHVHDGGLDVEVGPTRRPDVTAHADPPTLVALGQRRTTLLAAVAAGDVAVTGDLEVAARLGEALSAG